MFVTFAMTWAKDSLDLMVPQRFYTALLSGPDPALRVVGLMGDFIKGPLPGALEELRAAYAQFEADFLEFFPDAQAFSAAFSPAG